MNMTLKRAGWIMLVTLLLAAAAAMGMGLQAAGNAKLSRQQKEQYYKEQEKAYVKELRAYLAESGYDNSGVTLTRTTESDGSFYYNATIHHHRIDRMEAQQREVLLAELSELEAPVEEAAVYHEFLVLNP